MNAIDTNVLLYSIDRNEPVKQLKAQQLLQQLRTAPEPTILLWQLLGELTQQLRRWRDQGKLSSIELSQHIQAFRHVFSPDQSEEILGLVNEHAGFRLTYPMPPN